MVRSSPLHQRKIVLRQRSHQSGWFKTFLCSQAVVDSSTPCAGLEEVYDLGELSPYEEAGLKAMIPELQASIQKGIDFVAQS
jgi:hypothetical protein